jgi:tRNA(Ile)-lysidine synthase
MSQSPNFLKVRSAVRESLKSLEAGDCILVAVSGGADSLALAAATAIEGKTLALKVIGATVDHQLQKNSGDQAQKVAIQLRKLGIESTEILQVTVALENGVEASARTARYRALSELADRTNAQICSIRSYA